MWMIVRRGLFSIFVLIFVSVLLFVLTHATPVSPAQIVLGIEATPEQISEFEQQYGLNRPVGVQYISWVKGILLHGDFGQSYITGSSVSTELARTFPISLEIVLLGFAFAVLVSLPLGVFSAVYEGSFIDHIARIFAVTGVSIPNFWLSLMLIVYVSIKLGWLPPGGFVPMSDGLWPHMQSLVMPVFSLGISYMAIFSRMIRSSMVEVLEQDYIRTALAMGLTQRRILLYAIKNALGPVISIGAMSFGYMFGWALILEQVFNIAGLSRGLLNAIFQRDYLMIQATVLVISAVFIFANLVADILNRFLNPRITTSLS
jgi:peptide/nickel transport system permease protein